jgi:hypothetical protein
MMKFGFTALVLTAGVLIADSAWSAVDATQDSLLAPAPTGGVPADRQSGVPAAELQQPPRLLTE